MREVSEYTLVAWAVAILVGVAASVGVGVLLQLSRARLAAFAFAAAVVVAGALATMAATSRPEPARVSIDSPPDGFATDRPIVRISGTVYPPDARVTAVIRSETDDRWWVQSVVTPEGGVDGVGRWSLPAHFGTEREGAGESYQVIALASADGALADLFTGRHLSRGDRRRSVPLWAQSTPVTVRRAR